MGVRARAGGEARARAHLLRPHELPLQVPHLVLHVLLLHTQPSMTARTRTRTTVMPSTRLNFEELELPLCVLQAHVEVIVRLRARAPTSL